MNGDAGPVSPVVSTRWQQTVHATTTITSNDTVRGFWFRTSKEHERNNKKSRKNTQYQLDVTTATHIVQQSTSEHMLHNFKKRDWTKKKCAFQTTGITIVRHLCLPQKVAEFEYLVRLS
jgi:hypothetical protein